MLTAHWSQVVDESAGATQQGEHPLWFHKRLPGYRPSELHALPELAMRAGVGALFVKHEVSRFTLPSFKVLGASWAVYRALEQAAGRSLKNCWRDLSQLRQLFSQFGPRRLVAATDGNHGRAVAWMAAQMGLESLIFVPDGTAPSRIAAIRAEGAQVAVVSGDYDAAIATAAVEASRRAWVISDTSWPGYTDVPKWISDGYRTLFDEVNEQLPATAASAPDIVLVPVGVGALALAALAHYRGTKTRVIAVEPVGADCVHRSLQRGRMTSVPGPHYSAMAGLNCGTPSPVAWPTLSTGLAGSLVIEDEDAFEAMRALADCGLVAGETGAAGLGALLALAAEDGRSAARRLGITEQSSVLVVCTEGATDPVNYRSVVGRWPNQVAFTE